MKLHELAGVKRLNNMLPQEALDFIEQEFEAGRTTLRPLGAGSNGVALTNGTDVFKLWHRDGAYERFVKFCIENPNRFLPKFKSKIRELPRFMGIKTYRDEDGDTVLKGVKYIKMEMLEPYKGEEGFFMFSDPKIKTAIGADDDDLVNYMSFEDMWHWSAMGRTPREALTDLLKHLEDMYDADDDLVQYLEKLNPDILEMMGVMVKLNKYMGKDDRFDYGKRNLALRGNQVVILDPIVDDGDLDINSHMMDFVEWRKKQLAKSKANDSK